MLHPSDLPLPPVLAGPLLRRLEPSRLLLWLVGSAPLALTLRLQFIEQGELLSQDFTLNAEQNRVIAVGRHAFIHLIDLHMPDALPQDVSIRYDLLINTTNGSQSGIAEWAPHLLYTNAQLPDFVLHSRIHQLVHGSCRKPHHSADEGLLCVDRLLAAATTPTQRPALLMMSGDQVYADDVAGPMLRAIHGLIERLGLFDVQLDGGVVDHSAALCNHPASYSDQGRFAAGA